MPFAMEDEVAEIQLPKVQPGFVWIYNRKGEPIELMLDGVPTLIPSREPYLLHAMWLDRAKSQSILPGGLYDGGWFESWIVAQGDTGFGEPLEMENPPVEVLNRDENPELQESRYEGGVKAHAKVIHYRGGQPGPKGTGKL